MLGNIDVTILKKKIFNKEIILYIKKLVNV